MLDQSVTLRLTTIIFARVFILSSLLDLGVDEADVRTLILILFLVFMQTGLQKHRLIDKLLLVGVHILINIHGLRSPQMLVLRIHNIVVIYA